MFVKTVFLYEEIQLYEIYCNILKFFSERINKLKSKFLIHTAQQNMNTQFSKEDTGDEELRNNILEDSNKEKIKLLVIDDSKSWQNIIRDIIETLPDNRYNCDIASDDESIEKIEKYKYDLVYLSNSGNWFNLLKMLKINYPDLPVIMISGTPSVQNIQERYSNIRKIIYKDGESESSDFVTDIRVSLGELFQNAKSE